MTSGLGAEDAGLAMERGYIKVDAQYRTSVAGVSAIGDVITFDRPGHPQLAHLSSAEGIAQAGKRSGTTSKIRFHRIEMDQPLTDALQGANTVVALVVPATICTGELTVAPLAGVQMVTAGLVQPGPLSGVNAHGWRWQWQQRWRR